MLNSPGAEGDGRSAGRDAQNLLATCPWHHLYKPLDDENAKFCHQRRSLLESLFLAE